MACSWIFFEGTQSRANLSPRSRCSGPVRLATLTEVKVMKEVEATTDPRHR